jgi:predicted amidophosphoribosyltransferase
MAYPDLPPNPTFWRCSNCGNELTFYASGIGHIQCAQCGTDSTEQHLLEEHHKAHPEAAGAAAH